jgi:hypothetical protein
MMVVERTWVFLTASIAGALAAAIAVAPHDKPPARAPEAMTVIPLTGDAISQVVEDAQTSGGPCLPFLAWILAHPRWELQIVDGATGCLGETIRASYEIQHDGLVTWMEPGMPNRRVWLTPAELLAIQHLDRLSCAAPSPSRGYENGWQRVGLAGDIHAVGGATIPQDAPAAQAIDQMFATVTARYVRDRRAALGHVEIDLIASLDAWENKRPHYRVRIADERITIQRGKRTIATLTAEPADLVKLVDWALATPMYPSEDSTARGTLLVGGERRTIALERWDRPLFAIAREIEDKIYCDAKPDSILCR